MEVEVVLRTPGLDIAYRIGGEFQLQSGSGSVDSVAHENTVAVQTDRGGIKHSGHSVKSIGIKDDLIGLNTDGAGLVRLFAVGFGNKEALVVSCVGTELVTDPCNITETAAEIRRRTMFFDGKLERDLKRAIPQKSIFPVAGVYTVTTGRIIDSVIAGIVSEITVQTLVELPAVGDCDIVKKSFVAVHFTDRVYHVDNGLNLGVSRTRDKHDTRQKHRST